MSGFLRVLARHFAYREPTHMTPPITGDPYSLSVPGQTRGETLAMWARYLLAVWVATFVALLTVTLAAHPLAVAVCWLMLLVR